MRTRPPLNSRVRRHLRGRFSILVALCLAAAVGCSDGGGSSGSDSGVPGASATQSRDVEFGRASFKPVDNSLFFCPFSAAGFYFDVTSPTTTLHESYSSPLGLGESNPFSFLTDWGRLHAAPGDEVCISVTTWGWADGADEACHTIATGTNYLTYSFDVPRLNAAPGCNFEIELDASVTTFDAQAFCEESCVDYRACGRPGDGGCVATCVEAVQNAAVEDDEICHDATRDWLSCLHQAPCVDNPESYCGGSSEYIEQNALFASGQCVRPLPPPPPPDPLACDPRQSELRAGTEGDFFVIARTSDFPDKNYMVLDLSQLGEIDAVLAASPNDPVLSTARSVLPAIRGLDGSLGDYCDEAGIVAIRFEVDLSLATAAYADLDNQLLTLQSRLEELAGLAAEAKKQAVAFMMDQVLCPATFQAFSIFRPPYGEIAGIAAQASIGCFE